MKGIVGVGAVLAFALAGCTVSPHGRIGPYYRPSAASGVVGTYDRWPAGPDKFISFSQPDLPWLRLHLSFSMPRGFPPEQGPYSLNVTIQKNLPYWDTVLDQDYERIAEMRNRHFAIHFDSIKVTVTPAGEPPISCDLKLPYGGEKDFILSYQDYSTTPCRFKDRYQPPAYFDVDFPAVWIDGRKLDIPRIRFTYLETAFY